MILSSPSLPKLKQEGWKIFGGGRGKRGRSGQAGEPLSKTIQELVLIIQGPTKPKHFPWKHRKGKLFNWWGAVPKNCAEVKLVIIVAKLVFHANTFRRLNLKLGRVKIQTPWLLINPSSTPLNPPLISFRGGSTTQNNGGEKKEKSGKSIFKKLMLRWRLFLHCIWTQYCEILLYPFTQKDENVVWFQRICKNFKWLNLR